ncbi:unnamed protein product [Laminaria digitata]
MVNLVRLAIRDNEDLQCLPSVVATAEVRLDSDFVSGGTCECTPVEAVSCADGLSCQSGLMGYTCAP